MCDVRWIWRNKEWVIDGVDIINVVGGYVVLFLVFVFFYVSYNGIFVILDGG